MDGQQTPVAEPTIDGAKNIYTLLAARARREPSQRLAIDAGFGGIAAVSAPFLPTLWWALACPIVVVGAYGIWGLADRHIAINEPGDDPALRRDVLSAVKWAAVAIGTIAAVAAVHGLLFALIGSGHRFR
jgi:hypothetical protein